MAESPLFKRAFVRGLNTELIRSGAVVYPTKEAADHAADYIADNSGMPDPLTQGQALTQKVAGVICDQLVEASRYLCKEAGDKYSPALTKTAQEADPVKTANDEAWALMNKAAAETGSLMEGGDNPNDQPAAASENAEAALEANRRPENYANLGEDGVGGYERKGQGNVGTEEDHPEKPKATEEGSNSPIENTRKHGSSLADIVRKVAADTGQLMDPSQEKNDLPAAASNNAEAALEMNRRPENYANKGEKSVGRSDMVPGTNSQVGTEQEHPESPTATAKGKMNVPLEHVMGSDNGKTASAFDQLFGETARTVVPYLPERMEENHKVAHVRAMMGLDDTQRAAYLHDLYTQLGAEKTASQAVHDHFLKTAAEKAAAETTADPKAEGAETEKLGKELPPALRANAEKKKSNGEGKAMPFAGKETPEEEVAEHGAMAGKNPMAAKGSESEEEEEEEEESESKEASANGSRNSLSSLRAALANINA